MGHGLHLKYIVSVYNSQGKKEFEEETSTKYLETKGDPIAGDCVTQYIIDNNGTKILLTPHTIHVEKNGESRSLTVTMDEDKEITVRLNILTLTSKILIAVIIVGIIGGSASIYLVKRKRRG